MKKTMILLIGIASVVACNSSSDSSANAKKDTASAPAAEPATTSASEKGLELIGSSDCTTCHRLHKESAGATIGPSYAEVAARYPSAADTTVDRLVKKIMSGGSGVWGSVPMTPHPLLTPADIKTMVQYILTIKN